ncbi:MAG: hypothetical protein ACTHQ3_17910 [Motilibacteraceae bacterium]
MTERSDIEAADTEAADIEEADLEAADIGSEPEYEANPADVAEERAQVVPAEGGGDPLSRARGVGDPALEAPEADAIEQHRDVVPDGGEEDYPVQTDRGSREDVDAADRADQEREVVLDEDDYR